MSNTDLTSSLCVRLVFHDGTHSAGYACRTMAQARRYIHRLDARVLAGVASATVSRLDNPHHHCSQLRGTAEQLLETYAIAQEATR